MARGRARPALLGLGLALGELGLVAELASCGPDASDYPFLRPDAGYPDGLPPEEAGPSNIIEHDPLEDWDTTDAGPLSGIYAVELRIQAKVVVAVESRQLARFRLLQQGTGLRLRTQTCRLGLPSVQGVAELEVPIELEMLLRSKAEEHQGEYLSAAEPVGATFTPPGLFALVGADLGEPRSDPLPTSESPAAALDEDGDGHPGVTIHARTLLCEERESVYVALRTLGTLSGTVRSLERIEGSVEPELEQSVLGTSDPCMATAAALTIAIEPGSTFSAVRVSDELDLDHNGNVTCGEIVAAAGELFGPYWPGGG